jgi:hypothetical protein
MIGIREKVSGGFCYYIIGGELERITNLIFLGESQKDAKRCEELNLIVITRTYIIILN